MDKLRAGALGIFGDAVHYFCSRECKTAFGAASLAPPAPARPAPERDAGLQAPRDAPQPPVPAAATASPAAAAPEEPPVATPSPPPGPPPVEAAVLAPGPAPEATEPPAPLALPDAAHDAPRPEGEPAPSRSLARVIAPMDRRPFAATVLCVLGAAAPLVAPASFTTISLQLACLAGLLVLLGVYARTARASTDRLWLLAVGLATVATAAGAAPAMAAGVPAGAELPLAFAVVVAAIAILGLAIEARLATQATSEIRSLLEALPRSAVVVRSGREIETEIERVRAGEEVVVSAGEVVPVDGVVRSGNATVMPLSARDVSLEIGAGQHVIAGARVTRGELHLVATFVGAERTLARVARVGLGQDARPAASVRWSARAGLVTSGLGLAGAIAIATVAFLQKQPPAVGLATASAFLLALWGRGLERIGAAAIASGAGRAARNGAFFRDAAAIEATARVAAVVLPARSTLTEGAPHVTDLEAIEDRSPDPEKLLALAAAACLAAAPDSSVTEGLRAAAAERGQPLPEVRRPAHRPGRGVLAAAPGGEDLAVGSRALLLAEGVSIAAADEAIDRLEERGRTTVLVAIGGRVQGLVGLYDAPRPGARGAVDALHALGIEPVLLTGDSRTTAEALGRDLGIDHVRAEVEPDERAAEVRRLTESGTTVAVIGDPTRDGAALDAADVAIALQSAGAPQGDPAVRLVGDVLSDAVAALTAARRVMVVIRRNLTIASGALVLGGILAVGGLLPPPAAALLSTLSAVLMARTPRDPG